MASRDRREKESSKNAGGGTKPTARNITFFIPGVGIDREVISTDICRYLGNDALVKPAKHNGEDGFMITAYRSLTTEQLRDIRNDSAKWQEEKRRNLNNRGPADYFRSEAFQQSAVRIDGGDRQSMAQWNPYGQQASPSLIQPPPPQTGGRAYDPYGSQPQMPQDPYRSGPQQPYSTPQDPYYTPVPPPGRDTVMGQVAYRAEQPMGSMNPMNPMNTMNPMDTRDRGNMQRRMDEPRSINNPYGEPSGSYMGPMGPGYPLPTGRGNVQPPFGQYPPGATMEFEPSRENYNTGRGAYLQGHNLPTSSA